ncbi:MAG: hypothetical protein L7H10_04120 [Vulcanisaeta sp.]|nr:hypothetical protein [Vulcanisaeta sp.]MCG2869922.1 hypothetical protein [Vulcanisaeta sp.]
MKFLEELMNILFQEYGGLILTLASAVLSLIIITIFIDIVRNELVLIRELGNIIRIIGGVVR